MDENQLLPLTVLGVHQPSEDEPPQLVLVDGDGRQLQIPIGLCEALSIQLSITGTNIERPLTHNLLLTLAERLDAPIYQVVIDDYSQGTYFARLVLNSPEGQQSIDCRPSDGIAMAIRAGAPVLATEMVMSGEHEG
ncbi:MAG: bifunctional nuclease family protein [Armatimonadota bacterium]